MFLNTDSMHKIAVPIAPLHDVPRNPPTGQGFADIEDDDHYLEDEEFEDEETTTSLR